MRKSSSLSEIERCARTVSLTFILQVVARAHEAVLLSSAGKDVKVATYVLVDSGSTSFWCSETLAKRLGVVGSRVQVSLSTIETDSTSSSFCRVNLEIMHMAEVNMVELLGKVECFNRLRLHSRSMTLTDGLNCRTSKHPK